MRLQPSRSPSEKGETSGIIRKKHRKQKGKRNSIQKEKKKRKKGEKSPYFLLRSTHALLLVPLGLVSISHSPVLSCTWTSFASFSRPPAREGKRGKKKKKKERKGSKAKEKRNIRNSVKHSHSYLFPFASPVEFPSAVPLPFSLSFPVGTPD